MKRSPLKRSTGIAHASVKPKKCAFCGEDFFPARPMQAVCGNTCALRKVRRDKAEEVMATRAAKEAGKNLRKLKTEAQAEFNSYIRERDRAAGYGCICCGMPLEWDRGKPGGSVDAGHYMSRGSTVELSFDERNVNAQRKSCNRPGGTTRAAFKAGMVLRWGQAVVDELEGPHDLPKLRHDDYRQIRDTYRAKARALKKERT